MKLSERVEIINSIYAIGLIPVLIFSFVHIGNGMMCVGIFIFGCMCNVIVGVLLSTEFQHREKSPEQESD